MITVRLPSILRGHGRPAECTIDERVTTLDDLIRVLDTRFPGLAAELDDVIYNFAINDTLLLHGALAQPIKTGDVVEIVPTISGGADPTESVRGSSRLS